MSKTVRYILIPVLGPMTHHNITKWSDVRAYTLLKGAIGKHFDEPFERVNVLHLGEYRDMFVGETSAINGRHIRNIRATEIYRYNALANKMASDPEELPAICGPAVLFPDYEVWL